MSLSAASSHSSGLLEEPGQVVGMDADWVWVETRPRSACSSCSSAGCGGSLLSDLFGTRRNRLRLRNDGELQIGQQVVLGISERVLVRVAIQTYLLPLALLLLSLMGAVALGLGETLQVLMGMLGLAVGLVSLKSRMGSDQTSARYQPRLLRRDAEVAAFHPVRWDGPRIDA